jgi:hypothetical protein
MLLSCLQHDAETKVSLVLTSKVQICQKKIKQKTYSEEKKLVSKSKFVEDRAAASQHWYPGRGRQTTDRERGEGGGQMLQEDAETKAGLVSRADQKSWGSQKKVRRP